MSYTARNIGEVLDDINRTMFLPAIQREFVWERDGIEKLFDSLMNNYPIGSFLFWKIREESKKDWTAYNFMRDFDEDNRHNIEAVTAGVNQDIYLVLDGQQRLTALYIGLRGTYRYQRYKKWRKTRLYLNLFKQPIRSDDPEELTFQFEFRENDHPNPKDAKPQFWYLVSNVLNFLDAEDAKEDLKLALDSYNDALKHNAKTLVGKLHHRIHTARLLNYYEENPKDDSDPDRIVEIFVRTNTGGKKLEYADILLSLATANFKRIKPREELYSFTDDINRIGSGYTFEKDFVLKGSLYLTDDLPIQYKVKNFTKPNLEKIENNWETIKRTIRSTVDLVDRYGFSDRNLVAKGALLPIALYLKKLSRKHFVASSHIGDVQNQSIIQKWLTIVLLKGSFGGSSDTTLKQLQDTINEQTDFSAFPFEAINKKLNIEQTFSEGEIESLVATAYKRKYSYLILSLLYPDRDWKDNVYHEDHIFPKTEFDISKLRKRGYDERRIDEYRQHYNTILNLELVTESENNEKNAAPFDSWFANRDNNFKARHLIPTITAYSFDNFLEFIDARKRMISQKLKTFSS